MGERHFVANLIRRGHAWHWRARVPSTFRKCSSARLSLSFGGCDHKTAASLARHLNRRLHELKHEPKARMTTREQLARLMAAERDAEMERLDAMVMTRRRYGKGHDIIDVQEDLIHAWAYRLLQRWGVAGQLTFDRDCPGRAMLEAGGVGPEFVPHIAEAFLSTQDGLRTPVFDRRIRERLTSLGIVDTVPNRERGKAAVFEGRAEALFDYRERYAHVPVSDNPLRGESRAGDRTAERSALLERLHDSYGDEPVERTAQSTADSTTYRRSVPSSNDAIANARRIDPDLADPRVVFEPTPRLPKSEPACPPSGDSGRIGLGGTAIDDLEPDRSPSYIEACAVTNGGVEHAQPGRPTPLGKGLPVSKMLDQFEVLKADKGARWEKSTAVDARRAVLILIGILEEHDVTHSGEMTQFHLGMWRSHFNEVPTNYGRSSILRKMATHELRAEARRLRAEAEAAGKEPPAIGLDDATVRKHVANLESFLEHIRAYGYEIFDWSFKGLRPPKPKSAEVRHQTNKPKPEQIRPIFDAPHFHGSANWQKRSKLGDHVFHDSLYYIPMLFTYLGPRRAELAGLGTDDVYVHPDWGPIIHIRTNAFRRIKNIQSDRLLPVPDELVRLNFLDYRDRIAAIGEKRLFPELFSHLTENDPGDRFYDAFNPIIKKMLGEAAWERSMHALRHGFANTLKQAGVDTNVIDDISGRLSDGETGSRYTSPAEVPLIRTVISKIPKITAHIEPRPIRLLPWVEQRQNPPWARPPLKQ